MTSCLAEKCRHLVSAHPASAERSLLYLQQCLPAARHSNSLYSSSSTVRLSSVPHSQITSLRKHLAWRCGGRILIGRTSLVICQSMSRDHRPRDHWSVSIHGHTTKASYFDMCASSVYSTSYISLSSQMYNLHHCFDIFTRAIPHKTMHVFKTCKTR